jgi:subtilisin family serine protease/PKD repeat protein
MLLALSAHSQAPTLLAKTDLRLLQYADMTNVTSLIVMLKDGTDMARAAATRFSTITALRPLFPSNAHRSRTAMTPEAAALGRRLDRLCVAPLAQGASLIQAMEELAAAPAIEYVEPNGTVRVLAAPNDPRFPHQWALNNTGQNFVSVVNGVQTVEHGTADADVDWLEAWDTGSLTSSAVVAVIDSGVDYTHPDLVNQMWHNAGEIPNNSIDDDANGYVDDYYGYDFYNNDRDPMDDHGHGTHCAGTIAAATDNGQGIAGLAPQARIMALKFIGPDGGGPLDAAVAALRYAADNGAAVANNSWGSGYMYQALQDAVNYADARNCAVIAAAGNAGTSELIFPAAYDVVTAVAATDKDDHAAVFSNFGTWVDVAAPGVNILSLRATNTDMYAASGQPLVHIVDTNLYLANGTSMACPHAAGVAAALAARFPGIAGWLLGRLLQRTADNIDARNPSYTNQLGAGRVNLARALAYDAATTAFVRASAQMWMDDATPFLPPDHTTNIVVTVAAWTVPLDDVRLDVASLSAETTVNTGTYWLGAMPANASVTLSNVFAVTVAAQRPVAPLPQTVRVRVLAGANVLDETTLRFYLFNDYASSLSAADLDMDGIKEYITHYDNKLIVLDHRGILKWKFASPQKLMPFYGAAIGDVDGDGTNELAAGQEVALLGGAPGLYVFEHDGAIKPGWPRTDALSFGIPAMADCDEDGVLDIVVTCQRNVSWTTPALRAYKADGTVLWTRDGVFNRMDPPAIGDLDNDGWPEFVTACYQDAGGPGRILCTRHDGTDFGTTITVPEQRIVQDQPALGDVDGDGDMEIACIAFKSYGTDNKMYVYHHDGTLAAGWPQICGTNWIVSPETPRVVDVDGDRDLEIITAGYLEGLYGWQGNGTPLPNFPILDTKVVERQCIVEDLDGDGALDLIYSNNRSNSRSSFSARKLNGAFVTGYSNVLITNTGGIIDMLMSPMGINANQQLAFVAGGKSLFSAMVFIYNTSTPSNQLPFAWPQHPRDPQRTCRNDTRTNWPFACGFGADHTLAINPMRVRFTSSISKGDTNSLWYAWDFNNDGAADAAGVALVCTGATYGLGDHAVALTVSNAAMSATRTRTNYLHVMPPVVAAFSANLLTANAPITVQFYDASENIAQQWWWDFNGDGIIDATNQNPRYTYTGSGTFSVTLAVSNNFGLGGQSGSRLTKGNYIVVPDVENDGTMHYVAQHGLHWAPFKNWREAATNIGDAVAAAGLHHTVIVSDGVYRVAAPLVIATARVVSVNGPTATVIDGQFASRCVSLYGSGVLDGFTVRNGNARDTGHGIYALVNGTILNCIISNNGVSTTYNGGGLYCESVGTYVSNCVFVGNRGYSGGGAFFNHTYALDNCRFIGNTAGGNGGGMFSFNGRIRNCLFTDNTAQDGGGLWIRSYYDADTVTVENCTITRNTSLTPGGALYCFVAARVYNSIIHGNSGGDVTNRETAATYWNCCVGKRPPAQYIGTGVFAGDPLFANPAAGDFHLQALSPAIDTGSNRWVTSSNDFDNLPRIYRGIVDMGCYENRSPLSLAPPDILLPLAVPAGATATHLMDAPGALAIIGAKDRATLTYALSAGSWFSNAVAQSFSGLIWSNPTAFAAAGIVTQRYRLASAGVTNASAQATTLIVNVAPEPACMLMLLLGVAAARRR